MLNKKKQVIGTKFAENNTQYYEIYYNKTCFVYSLSVSSNGIKKKKLTKKYTKFYEVLFFC